MILCDKDIFIEALKNDPNAINALRRIGFKNIALSSITVMELYFGAINKRELIKIKSRIHMQKIINIDKDISELATNLIERYAKSHGLGIPDALIAATAICQSIELLTYNVKDFKFIDSIQLYNPNK